MELDTMSTLGDDEQLYTDESTVPFEYSSLESNFEYTPIEVNDDSEPKFRYKKTLTGHTDTVNDICFDPTGSSLISASKDGTVKIWDIKKGSPVLDMKSKKAKKRSFVSVAISSDGNTLASVMDSGNFFCDCVRTIAIMNRDTEKWMFRRLHDTIQALAFNPKKPSMLVSGSHEGLEHNTENKIKIWDCTNEKKIKKIKTLRKVDKEGLTALAIDPQNENLLASLTWEILRLWDMEHGARTESFQAMRMEGDHLLHREGSLLFHPTQKDLIITQRSNIIEIWNRSEPNKTAKRFTLTGRDEYDTGFTQSIAVSPNGKELIVCSASLTHVWDIDTGTLIQKLPNKYTFRLFDCCSDQDTDKPNHNNYMTKMALSPDGKTLATCSADKTIKVWEK
jgi:WD40 repeat protein